MSSAEQKVEVLLAALIGVIGVSSPEELDIMEAYMRAAEIPEHDKMISINAINAIRVCRE